MDKPELEANDKTDALFAEYVMGWMAVGPRRKPMPGTTMDHDVWMGVRDRKDILREIPRYSSELEEAWHGFERFPWPRYWSRLQQTDSGKWRCDIELHGGDGPTISAVADKPALAIVRCLLQVAEKEPMDT
jgi:anti-sigma-K factor RskA